MINGADTQQKILNTTLKKKVLTRFAYLRDTSQMNKELP